MEKKEIIKYLLFSVILLYSGFGMANSINNLNDFTTTMQDPYSFEVKEFNFNDLQTYNKLIIERFEFTLIFIVTLVLMFSDVKNISGGLDKYLK